MVEAGGESIRISSPGKLLFPKQGWTKLDVVNHFVVVSEGAIRGIFGRPTMLKRYMESVEVNPIYHKRADKNSPFETVEIRFPSQRPGMMIVPRRETRRDQARPTRLSRLSSLAGSSRGHRSPGRVANRSRSHSRLRLQSRSTGGARCQGTCSTRLGLRGWPKTSGSRGIHIYMRIVPEWDFYQARRAVLALARELERRHPGLITTKWWKEERKGIFIDYNQMARDKTVSSAYGVRPTGYVSAPLRWEEIPDVSIEDFPLDKFADRYREVGDLTKGIDESAGRLETLLEWVVRDQEEYGQGDAPWPPQYPKVAGEPPRVQPSRKRMADPDEDKPSEQKEGSTYTIEEYLSDKGEKGRKFWDGLVALARRCGEFQFAPAKTRSGLMLRARFVVVFTLSDRGMTFGLSMASPTRAPSNPQDRSGRGP